MEVAIPGVSKFYRRLRLPLSRSRSKTPDLLMSNQSATPFDESFRLLALNVGSTLAEASHKGVVVMSAFPGDGRSLVTANLAIALAEHDRAIAVDAHSGGDRALRELFTPHDDAPRSDLPRGLQGVVEGTNRSRVWLAEAHESHASGVYAIQEIIQTASNAGIFTVVDSPPSTTSSDAFLLAQRVGHVVYVVRHVAQDMEVHRQVRAHLSHLDAKIIGLVLNEV
jgi:Mrp family chromosome partitioning ATPase